MSDFGLYLLFGVMIVLFAGEPDLHDKLMVYFDNQCATPE